MIQFLKDSLREIKHVVWPTRKETQKYFVLVLILLVLFGTYLFIFSNIFSTIVLGLKDTFWPENGAPATNSSLTDEEIDALFSNEVDLGDAEISTTVNIDSETQVGEATASGETSPVSE